MVSGLESLRRAAAPMVDHPAFGLVRATPCPAGGPWLWESLELFETRRGSVDLGFEAGPEGPGDAHRVQLEAIVAQLDALTAAAAPMIFDHLDGLEASALPWAELEWRGACLTGRRGEFRLEYSCRSRPDSVAVRFERSQPVAVEIDG